MIVFVTDSNLGAGLPPGRYNLPGGWGNVLVQGSNDGVRIIDREMVLAGSALTMLDSFRNALRLFGRDLAKASTFCSRNPARILGLNKGEIEPGRDADLIVLNKDLELVCTISRGSVVYRKHMV
jgi:N-acetylglucosamine-6-phosphate deacetylase